MSDDNIIYPTFPVEAGKLGGGGDGPHNPSMDQRVAILEADMKDVKGSLGRIETTLAVVAEGMKALATKAELSAVSAKVDGLATRLDKVERTVDSKVLGPWQFPLILAASAAVLIAAFGGFSWLVAHGYFPHSP